MHTTALKKSRPSPQRRPLCWLGCGGSALSELIGDDEPRIMVTVVEKKATE
jgi:hypothetical protein